MSYIPNVASLFLQFFKRFYFFTERQKGREKEKETSLRGRLLQAPTGDPACNPGMCPDWESNQQPFDLQAGAQSTEPHQPGLFLQFLCLCEILMLMH